jgi:hypothetical protein
MDSLTILILGDGWGTSHSDSSVTAEALARVLAKRCKIYFAIPNFDLETFKKAEDCGVTLLKPWVPAGAIPSILHLPLIELGNLQITHVIGISDLTSSIITQPQYKPYTRIIVNIPSHHPEDIASHAQSVDMVVSLGHKAYNDLDRELDDRLRDVHHMFNQSILRGDFRVNSLRETKLYRLLVLYEDTQDMTDLAIAFGHAERSLRDQNIDIELTLLCASKKTSEAMMKIAKTYRISAVDIHGDYTNSLFRNIQRSSMFCILPSQLHSSMSEMVSCSGIPVVKMRFTDVYTPVLQLTSIFKRDGTYGEFKSMYLSLRDEHESEIHVEIDRLVHIIQTGDDFSRNVVSEHSVPQASSDEVISPTPSALQPPVASVPQSSAAPSDSRECGVCFEPIEKMVILVPCFHARFCEKCARSVTECPECRANISDVRVPYV